MMALVSVRIDDALLREMKAKANALHLSQTDYIRKAIALMNSEMEKSHRKKRLMRASLRVRKNSAKVNAEFDRISDDSKD